ncbi:MAG: radical SAM protein [Sulfuricurvum sp. PC08-66]|nr:MAG: radical SAM protein [Sulfuricurvum sp. PC08-66]
MKKVFFKTFGCRTNTFDTQVMMSRLQNYTVTEEESQADVVVVNSCTVTNGADSSVRGYVHHMQKHQPHTKLFLTGCGAHTKGETLWSQQKVFGVFGQSQKASIDTLLAQEQPFYDLGDLNFVDETIVTEFVGKSRAFVKIQEGCNFRCSYCIIPYVRGDARDMVEAGILAQISTLAAHGYGEFILTGTNMGSYGNKAAGTSLAKLLQKISLIRGVRRVRLGSLEPIQIDDAFKELLGEPWMARHLHVAIQHTHDDMLRIMNRRNRHATHAPLLEFLTQAGYALGTDFIVGHPGETPAMWQEALVRFRTLPLTHLHAFTYSKRDNTPSASMPNSVDGAMAKERMAALLESIDANNYAFRKAQAHLPHEVLIESQKGEYYYGLDQFFNPIYIQSGHDIQGDWLTLTPDVQKEANYGSF